MSDSERSHLSAIPHSHLGAVSRRVGDYPVIQSLPTPSAAELKPGEALVRICYAGVCHSDVALALGKGTHRPMEPVISGHEGTGYIVALGLHIRPGESFKIGDRVGIKFIADTCGTCEACEAGEEEYCGTPEISGISRQGVFQQFVVASTMHLTPIPDEVDLITAAPILCAGLTVYKALLQANLRPGDWVVIPGAGGGLGHLAVQYAMAMNYRVIAIDTGEGKHSLMQRYGVHRWIDFLSEQNIAAAVRTASGSQTIKAAIITAGTIGPYQQVSIMQGSSLEPVSLLVELKSCAFIAGFDVPRPKIDSDVVDLIIRPLRIIGSSVGNRAEAKMALNFVALGKVKVETQQRPMSEIAKVYKEIEAGKVDGRIVLNMIDA